MIKNYLRKIQTEWKSGLAGEHSYRPALKELLEGSLRNVHAINEPARTACGAPDFVLRRSGFNIGYLEAKDIGLALDGAEKSEQMQRYRAALDNLILTDYLEFRFFAYGEKVAAVRIANIQGERITSRPDNFARLGALLLDFSSHQPQTLTSAKDLAAAMAHKARLMKDVFLGVLRSRENSGLKEQHEAFKAVLMPHMNAVQFADVYAQTIAYGLFTARLHDETPADFSRSESLLLIPKSNPFLQSLFSYLAGPQLDDRVVWIVDALCELFLYADLQAILKDFRMMTGAQDPMLHFYETFLNAYDPQLRKIRGVWYTPAEVVAFIIRCIDEILKTHFNLTHGLADTSKITVPRQTQDPAPQQQREMHKVQLLDIATGTGTFIAAAIKHIYQSRQEQAGIWSSYVEQDLLPRLHGFELLMAPYAICHMKIDLLLKETGYDISKAAAGTRLGVYLTNALEKHRTWSQIPVGFIEWLTAEANASSEIKNDTPIMVAFGNPPYSGVSMNKSYTENDDYKKEPGGKLKLDERKHWLDDDYVKFIRYAESLIEKNENGGVVGLITAHGYIDNPTFRGMRWHLRRTFDAIYVLDLHGNSRKKEVCPDGSVDQNVFDIMTGVAIFLGIKRPRKNKRSKKAEVFIADLWGRRAQKLAALAAADLQSVQWKKLPQKTNIWRAEGKGRREYEKGFSLTEIFPQYSTGIVSMGDEFIITDKKQTLEKRLTGFLSKQINEQQLKFDFNLGKNYPKWILENKKGIEISAEKFIKISYRPFDDRWTYFDKKLIWRTREKIMQHFLHGENTGLVFCKQVKQGDFNHIGIATNIIESSLISNKTGEINYIAPLYLHYPDGNEKPNISKEIWATINNIAGDATPENILDYIYAVLHTPVYRQKFAEFLKADFPRIPYPKNKKSFAALAEKGALLRQLHLLQGPHFDRLITTYPVAGDHRVEKPVFKKEQADATLGKVYINRTQYFGDVPAAAWNFHIGGYQPAQKWLKDRKGRTLDAQQVRHYQHIIIALTRTHDIMGEIEKIGF